MKRTNNPDAPIIGVLSAWTKVTTQHEGGEDVKGDHGFTTPDLVRLVKTLRDEFSRERLAYIEELIARHISRMDNPHLTDLEKLNTSVLQELYKAWLEEGYIGSREEFLKVLFQFIKIADIATTLEGTSYNQVVTAAGLKAVMDRHDGDSYAHDRMLARLFPGSPVQMSPSLSLEPLLDVPANLIVERDSPMWILDECGIMRELPTDRLEPDWSIGTPGIPVFSEIHNEILESENFSDTRYWESSNVKFGTDPTVQSLYGLERDSFVIQELFTDTPEIHSIQYSSDDWLVEKGKYYTITVFAATLGRHCLGIEVFDSLSYEDKFGFKGGDFLPFDQGVFVGASNNSDSHRTCQFDLDTGEVFVHADSPSIRGRVYDLHNGYKRLQMTFRATSTIDLQFRVYLLDHVDGDKEYEGVEGLGIALFGVTCTNGAFIPPYIPSRNGVRGRIAKTTLKMPVVTTKEDELGWFREDAGTFVMRFNNYATGVMLDNAADIYGLGDDNRGVSLLARMPVGHQDRVFFIAYSESGTLLSHWSEPSSDEWMNIVHGYSITRHLLGTSANDGIIRSAPGLINIEDSKFLYIGSDRLGGNQINAFMQRVLYYPTLLEEGNVEFFNVKVKEVTSNE